jgi:6-pyruvoyltetrahydropterin/6-carboxytetrahydropterin synthase
MYTLAIQREFIARHFLIGGDWGPENELHSHSYKLEVRLSGDQLDQHGYLLDIVELEAILDSLIARYRDATLNDLPEFDGLNPSIEHFARILCQTLDGQISLENITQIEVQLWENEIAWTAFRQER